jgi:hypothetical protein
MHLFIVYTLEKRVLLRIKKGTTCRKLKEDP